MRAAERVAGVDAVDDLARGADCAVEAELARELLDDLLQRRRDDVDGLPTPAVAGDEAERLLVDERLQNRLHRSRHEAAEVVDAKALQHHQTVLRGLPHGLGARSACREEQLPGGGLGELAAPDHAVLAERAGERERVRAPQQRAVEVEKGSGLSHPASLDGTTWRRRRRVRKASLEQQSRSHPLADLHPAFASERDNTKLHRVASYEGGADFRGHPRETLTESSRFLHGFRRTRVSYSVHPQNGGKPSMRKSIFAVAALVCARCEQRCGGAPQKSE